MQDDQPESRSYKKRVGLPLSTAMSLIKHFFSAGDHDLSVHVQRFPRTQVNTKECMGGGCLIICFFSNDQFFFSHCQLIPDLFYIFEAFES